MNGCLLVPSLPDIAMVVVVLPLVALSLLSLPLPVPSSLLFFSTTVVACRFSAVTTAPSLPLPLLPRVTLGISLVVGVFCSGSGQAQENMLPVKPVLAKDKLDRTTLTQD